MQQQKTIMEKIKEMDKLKQITVYAEIDLREIDHDYLFDQDIEDTFNYLS